MWHAAYARSTDDFNSPLLSLYSQSIELSIKDAMFSVSNQKPPPSHDLSQLWSGLRGFLEEIGQETRDSFSEAVFEYIRLLVNYIRE